MNIQSKLDQIKLMLALLEQHNWGEQYPAFMRLCHTNIDSMYKSLGEMIKVHDSLRSYEGISEIDYDSWRRQI